MLDFKIYNKQELFDKIDAIEITKVDNLVVTKYFDRVINSVPVSNRYEIFDIRAFLKQKISLIESNFPIFYYSFVMKRGVQHLKLLSEKVEINGQNFFKSFFILNSSDKSRRLNMNMGLYNESNNMYLVFGINNMDFSKKHLTGITQKAEEISQNMSGETFTEQIDCIKSLIGERVMLSKLKEIIIDADFKINHRKFDALKNQLRFSNKKWTSQQVTTLMTQSENLVLDVKNDFSIDAYMVFNLYMLIFKNQDSYIVKKETERIMKLTQCFIRNEKLSQLLMLD
jgi:hypothetical protein